MSRVITITYLQMLSPDALRPRESAALRVKRLEPPDGRRNRELYTTVGAPWQWFDRLPWSDAEWQAYAARPGLETWLAFDGEKLAGYYEWEAQAEEQAQLLYFGLLPECVGRGLGGALLTSAIRRGWQLATRRIWVHTCTDDHPHALDNYLARGFTVYRTAKVMEPGTAEP
jgi:GNAT superfamily N-acetyltransferase